MEDSQNIAILIGKILKDKKGQNTVIYQCGDKIDYTDYIILTSGVTNKHLQTMLKAVIDELSELGIKPISVEGSDTGRWIIIDYADIVIHIFIDPVRKYYDFDAIFEGMETVE